MNLPKDLWRVIGGLLHGRDLINFCKINKTAHNCFDETYWHQKINCDYDGLDFSGYPFLYQIATVTAQTKQLYISLVQSNMRKIPVFDGDEKLLTHIWITSEQTIPSQIQAYQGFFSYTTYQKTNNIITSVHIRLPRSGDKLVARPAQMSPIGYMPWSPIIFTVPDIVINPLCLPNRSTENQLIESVKAQTLIKPGRETPYAGFNLEKFKEEYRKIVEPVKPKKFIEKPLKPIIPPKLSSKRSRVKTFRK